MTSRAFAKSRRVPVWRLVDAQLYALLAQRPLARLTTFLHSDRCRCGYRGLVHVCTVRTQPMAVKRAGGLQAIALRGHGPYCRRCNPQGCPTCRLIERNKRENDQEPPPDPRPRTGDRMAFKRHAGSFRTLRYGKDN